MIHWLQKPQCSGAQHLKSVDYTPSFSLSLGYAYQFLGHFLFPQSHWMIFHIIQISHYQGNSILTLVRFESCNMRLQGLNTTTDYSEEIAQNGQNFSKECCVGNKWYISMKVYSLAVNIQTFSPIHIIPKIPPLNIMKFKQCTYILPEVKDSKSHLVFPLFPYSKSLDLGQTSLGQIQICITIFFNLQPNYKFTFL